MGVTIQTARKCRNRFAEHRLDGLDDEPRSGHPGRIDDDAVAEVVRKTLEETPPDVTQWSTRSMMQAPGYAPSTINRICRAFSLQPNRSETSLNPRVVGGKSRGQSACEGREDTPRTGFWS